MTSFGEEENIDILDYPSSPESIDDESRRAFKIKSPQCSIVSGTDHTSDKTDSILLIDNNKTAEKDSDKADHATRNNIPVTKKQEPMDTEENLSTQQSMEDVVNDQLIDHMCVESLNRNQEPNEGYALVSNEKEQMNENPSKRFKSNDSPIKSSNISATNINANEMTIPSRAAADSMRLLNISTSPQSTVMIRRAVKMEEEKIDSKDNGVETRTVNDINLSSSKRTNQNISEELEDSLAAGPSGFNKSSHSSNIEDDSLVSTSVYTDTASMGANKPRKIIVIKKPLKAGMPGPANSQIVRKISLADFEKLGANSSNTKFIVTESGSGAEKIRYIVKSVLQQPSPSKSIKVENGPHSGLKISNISSPTLLGSALSSKPKIGSTRVTFSKDNTKIVVNKQNTIYRCKKCHLLFTSSSQQNFGRVVINRAILPISKHDRASLIFSKNTAYEECSMHQRQVVAYELCGEKYMECKHCDKKFLKKERYDEHMEIYFPKDIYPCGVCKMKYPSHAAALEHIKIAHAKRLSMKCGLCNYETFVKQNFEKHASMHLRYVEKLNTNTFYKCDQCPQSFREPSFLKMHKDHMHAE